MGLTDAVAALGLSSSPSPKPQGRFGDDSMGVGTDPRANQAMVEVMKKFGMHIQTPQPVVDVDCTREQLLDFLRNENENTIKFVNAVPLTLDRDEQHPVTTETKTISGGAGQDMKLFITRPKGSTKDSNSSTLPCIIYIHGGGMTIGPTDNPVHHYWCRDLATGGASGAVVVMPDFRNAYDDVAHDLRHFPTGLDDCVAAVEWVSSHKAELGLSASAKVLVSGESGGGNLSIATALRLKREGKSGVVDGVYARCPFISGAYRLPRERLVAELPSLVECDGYLLTSRLLALIARAYSGKAEDYTDPVAWASHASEEDLKGSVPHTILVDELDPLRDEGVDFARKLERAGVKTVSRLSLGTIHAGPFLMRVPLWNTRFADVEDMHGFIKQL